MRPLQIKFRSQIFFTDRKKTSSSVLPSRIGKFVLFCRAIRAQSLALRPICFFVSLWNERRTIISLLHQCRADPQTSKHSQTLSAPSPLMLPHFVRTPENFLHPRLIFDIDLDVLWIRCTLSHPRRIRLGAQLFDHIV